MVHQEKLQGLMRAKTISLCDERQGSLVKRLRLRPLTPATRVRFPHESPKGKKAERLINYKYKRIVGVDDAEGPPVPIPNTEVKLSGAENTWLVTAREDREMPTQSIHPNGCFALYSSIAQSVERMTVNHDVTGSSPVGGATKEVSN